MKRPSRFELETAIADLVRKSQWVLSKCPAGKEPIVKVAIQFVPVLVPVVFREFIDPKLVPSTEPFTNEHFDAILELLLSRADRAFVNFMRDRNNRPCTPSEWIVAGFAEHGRYMSINNTCVRHGLWIRFRPCAKPHGNWLTKPHKFFVMKEK